MLLIVMGLRTIAQMVHSMRHYDRQSSDANQSDSPKNGLKSKAFTFYYTEAIGTGMAGIYDWLRYRAMRR